MTERPCKDCSERYLGCHDYCKKYLDDRDRRLAQKEEMRRQDNGNEQLRAIYGADHHGGSVDCGVGWHDDVVD